MDLDETREWLGDRGVVGAALVALGTTLVVPGVGLVAGGLVDSALEKTGMKGAL